jgi:hypothetical protein
MNRGYCGGATPFRKKTILAKHNGNASIRADELKIPGPKLLAFAVRAEMNYQSIKTFEHPVKGNFC